MGQLGRNEPCHCGSGRKYKKCCLRQDEERQKQEARQQAALERDVQAGRIDPFAGDGVWEDEPVPEPEEIPEDEPPDEDRYGEAEGTEPQWTSWDRATPELDERELTEEEEAVVAGWWAAYRDMSDPDAVRRHLEDFMTARPELVSELGLGDGLLFELGAKYVRQDRHAEYIDVLSGLRREFRDVYREAFGYFERDMIAWLVMNDQREEVAEHLEDFRRFPSEDPDNLFATVHFLMSWNCQDLLADFIPHIYREVCASWKIMGGDEILIPLATLLMAPFLDRGLDGCDPTELAGVYRTLGSVVNPLWTDPEFLQKRLHHILNRHQSWDLDGCRTRSEAVLRYDEATSNFMGWLAARKKLDWCAAEYHRQLILEYLNTALPETHKPREPFPFAAEDMERLLGHLTRKLMWPDSNRLFGLLNGSYWFLQFLEETGSLDAALARERREACTRLFEQVYPSQRERDFTARAWERFPREP